MDPACGAPAAADFTGGHSKQDSIKRASTREDSKQNSTERATKRRNKADSPDSDAKQDASSNASPARSPGPAPFYKLLEGMPLAVDAFKYGAIPGCRAYFLTHFHSDHYVGLTSRWSHGPIYCSAITARLVQQRLRVASEWLHTLPMDEPVAIPASGGVQVTCIDANHCPGACLMLFEGPRTGHAGAPRNFRYLHCGDFRASPWQVAHPAVSGRKMDIIYLDTTYMDPRYCFPAQPDVIQACAEFAAGDVQQTATGAASSALHQWLDGAQSGGGRSAPAHDGRPLILVGTYSIGKENLVKALARRLGTRIYCLDASKYKTYQQLADPELDALLTCDPLEARVHVTNMFSLTVPALRTWVATLRGRGMAVTRTLAFRPTGWSHGGGRAARLAVSPAQPLGTLLTSLEPPGFTTRGLTTSKDSTAEIQLYSVPYSEHSSFYELMAFSISLPHARIIPTMRAWTDLWTQEAQKREREGLGPLPARSPAFW
ncbi:DNA cross-link repair protein PSO2/SNM1 [Malassezia sp. CBS 17886]|nr:DNA cross-link repair protein PSO2/SNM1 [Malassezia sp. CBS 17886]